MFLKVFYFTFSKVDFLMFTSLFNSNKFFQIPPPFFSTAKEAEKEKIYQCIHNFASHSICEGNSFFLKKNVKIAISQHFEIFTFFIFQIQVYVSQQIFNSWGWNWSQMFTYGPSLGNNSILTKWALYLWSGTYKNWTLKN